MSSEKHSTVLQYVNIYYDPLSRIYNKLQSNKVYINQIVAIIIRITNNK